MEATRKKTTTFNIVMVGLSAALICIAGPFAIPIPFSPVPISLIPLAIFICAFLLDWKLCGLSYVIFRYFRDSAAVWQSLPVLPADTL